MSESTLLAVFLRHGEAGEPVAEAVYSPDTMPRSMALRMRYNHDIRGLVIPFPRGTTPERVLNALDLLSRRERKALYGRMRWL